MSRTATDLDSRPWAGPNRHYDIVKEGAIALAIVSVLVVIVVMHVLLVRKHGVVPPIDAIDPESAAPSASEGSEVAS